MYSIELLNGLLCKKEEWIKAYRLRKFEEFEKLPVPSWKRLKLENFSIPDFKEYRKEFLKNDIDGEGIFVKDINDVSALDEFKEYIDVQKSFGISDKFVTLGEAFYNSGVVIKAASKLKEPVRISYSLDNENSVVIDHNIIVAERDSEITVVIDYSSLSENEEYMNFFHNGVTKVYAADKAVVNIVKVQRMSNSAYHFDSNVAFIGREAKVNWISVEIGSGISATSFITNLEKTASESSLKSIYFGDGESRIDMQYTMNHIGMRSISNIETRGALKDKARKVFRGNLDFKKGARKAKGEEAEYALLLDPTVKADAIPVLFCAEDDVQGNHAASAGQIDENQLFYLMSRGFNEKEAKKLIVEASFKPIIDSIPVEDIKESINLEIHRRLVYV
ncbi:Fe-S cluster assembly protein SufD [Fonticella tunisiensis]|uniref:Iron-regulated ABC transporter permease protein SufD n=1 Tax=Fonticella tunisiensis TaxID=1096341 RepID=A0A4R7KPC9_9CLOT|nr:Fe-S cluster assembly protein SufD [Fonticella tunisiensis]TDT60980.1 iron-regulated ABC transporter permease protein SufD [Fonticella tunisiensis]